MLSHSCLTFQHPKYSVQISITKPYVWPSLKLQSNCFAIKHKFVVLQHPKTSAQFNSAEYSTILKIPDMETLAQEDRPYYFQPYICKTPLLHGRGYFPHQCYYVKLSNNLYQNVFCKQKSIMKKYYFKLNQSILSAAV